MKFTKSTVAASLLIAVLATGCRTAPIYDVTDAPVVTNSHPVTAEQVNAAIKRAGLQLGWQMSDAAPGHIKAVLHLREHMAQTDIAYNTKTYSITYQDSSNLKHSGNQIHSNYNGWIQRLDQAIRVQLSAL